MHREEKVMRKNRLFLLATTLLTISSCGLTPTVSSSLTPSSSEVESSSEVSTVESLPPSSSSEVSYIQGSYQNPLFVSTASGSYYSAEIADPCVVRGDDGYIYCFATAGRVLRSEDGCEWEIYKENIIPRPAWGDGYYTGKIPIIWAPDVVKIDDQWIYYYSLSAWGGPCGIGYATADEIGGPYTDQGVLFTSAEANNYDTSLGVSNSIDQQVIIDDDGSVYMVFGSFVGCYLVQLTDDGMGLYGGIEYQRENKVLIAGTPGNFSDSKYEGSWIFEKDGVWYYMGSSGTCCNGKSSTYHVLVGKADNIAGPYYDSEGHRLDKPNESTAGDLVIWSKPSNELTKAPGHHSILLDDAGDYWWYGHCYYEYDNFKTRHLAMDKILWDENDMPYVEGKQLSYNDEIDGPQWLEA